MYETKKSIFLVNIRPWFRNGGGGGGNDAVNIDFSSLENSICDLKRNIVDFLKHIFVNENVMNWGILEESAFEHFKRATVCYFAII